MVGALALGCRPAGECRSPEAVPERPSFAVTLTDFQVGALALGDATGATGPLWATTGDPLVRIGPDALYVVERGGADVVTAFDPSDPGCPRWQVALPRGANAHDLLAHDGLLWVPAYDLPTLFALDPADGALVHALDLSDASESDDGLPELDRVFAAGGRLWVSAQRLVRDGAIWTGDDGWLLEIDPAGPAWVASHPVGANPRVRQADASSLLVATGLLARGPHDPLAAQRLVDGALARFDTDARALGPALITEAELGGDLGVVAPRAGGLVVAVIGADASSAVHCLDGDSWRAGPAGAAWLVEGAAIGDDVLLLARRGLGAGGTPGLRWLDPRACAWVGEHPTALEPYDLVPMR